MANQSRLSEQNVQRPVNDEYLVDAHTHLEYGPLSKDYVLLFAEEAARRGLSELHILDHTHRFKEFEPIYEHLRLYPQQAKWLDSDTKFCSTLDEYHALIEEVRALSLPVRLQFGLEVCYTKDTEEFLRKVLSRHNFDFLTGAVHSINSILYDMSFSRELLWDRFSADSIYHDYWQAVFSCAASGLFDRLAHPDTIKLFGIYPNYDQKPEYEKLSRLLKQYDVTAENNTGCYYRYDHPDLGLSDELLEVFKQHGVRMITASDAHRPEDVGNYIREADMRIRGESGYERQSV